MKLNLNCYAVHVHVNVVDNTAACPSSPLPLPLQPSPPDTVSVPPLSGDYDSAMDVLRMAITLIKQSVTAGTEASQVTTECGVAIRICICMTIQATTLPLLCVCLLFMCPPPLVCGPSSFSLCAPSPCVPPLCVSPTSCVSRLRVCPFLFVCPLCLMCPLFVCPPPLVCAPLHVPPSLYVFASLVCPLVFMRPPSLCLSQILIQSLQDCVRGIDEQAANTK